MNAVASTKLEVKFSVFQYLLSRNNSKHYKDYQINY